MSALAAVWAVVIPVLSGTFGLLLLTESIAASRDRFRNTSREGLEELDIDRWEWEMKS